MSKNLAQQRREEIINAAHKCFIAKGFHATGMADIAREFGMSAGHIYNYFPSKTAIIEEVISRGMTLQQVRRVFGDCFKRERIVLSLELLTEAAHDPELEKVLQKADVKARTHLKEICYPESDDPSDWIRVELGMATIEGIGLRFLRNPNLNFDLVCELLAERIYTPREKLKQKIKELESKAA